MVGCRVVSRSSPVGDIGVGGSTLRVEPSGAAPVSTIGGAALGPAGLSAPLLHARVAARAHAQPTIGRVFEIPYMSISKLSSRCGARDRGQYFNRSANVFEPIFCG